jgi:hypothetical protein
MKTTDNRRHDVATLPLEGTYTIHAYVAFPTTASGSPRRYSLHVQPEERVTYPDGYTVTRYTPTDGYRVAIEEAPRYSRRRLEALATHPDVRATAERIAERIRAEHVAR